MTSQDDRANTTCEIERVDQIRDDDEHGRTTRPLIKVQIATVTRVQVSNLEK